MEKNLEKNWEGKQRSEPVFSQDAWLSLFSRALKGEAQNGDQHVRGAGETKVKPQQVACIVVPTGPRSIEGSRIGQEGSQGWRLAEG